MPGVIPTPSVPAAPPAGARLREAGLRVTAQRVAVLESLPRGQHLDAEAVATSVRGRLGSISTQAVYDALRALAEVGLVRRVEPAGSAALFESRAGDNHHHVVCRACGLTQDVDCAVGAVPCLEPSSAAGFVLDEAEVTWWGLCPACQEDRDAARTATTHEHPTPAPTG